MSAATEHVEQSGAAKYQADLIERVQSELTTDPNDGSLIGPLGEAITSVAGMASLEFISAEQVAEGIVKWLRLPRDERPENGEAEVTHRFLPQEDRKRIEAAFLSNLGPARARCLEAFRDVVEGNQWCDDEGQPLTGSDLAVEKAAASVSERTQIKVVDALIEALGSDGDELTAEVASWRSKQPGARS